MSGPAREAVGSQRPVRWALIVLGTIAAAFVAYRLSKMTIVLGSNDGRWAYVYLQGYQPRFARAFLRVVLICSAMLLVPLRIVRRYEWWAVVAWLIVGVAVQAMIRQETRYTLEQIFVSDGANSFYQPTLHHDAISLLRNFDRIRPELPTHARSNMPGKLLLVSALQRLSHRPTTLAWLVVLISDLGGILLYLFVRDLFEDRTVAYVSLIFYLFVPAKLYFFPILNTITPVLILACAWLWLRALRSGRTRYAVSLGVAVYGVAFFDPLALVMGLLFLAIVPVAMGRIGQPWRACLRLGGVTVVGCLATDAAMWAWLRFDLLTTFRAVAADAASFNVVAQRPYGIWVHQNILDFLFGIGVCQAVLAFASIAHASYRVVTARRKDVMTIFSLAVGSVLLTTDVIGVNRGEVIRLWIFLACFFQVPAAYICASLNSRVAVLLVLGTTLLQDILGTAMFNFAQP